MCVSSVVDIVAIRDVRVAKRLRLPIDLVSMIIETSDVLITEYGTFQCCQKQQ